MWASKVYRVRECANAGSTRYERSGLTQVSTCGASESLSVSGRSGVFVGKESAMPKEVNGALASTTFFAPFPSTPVFSVSRAFGDSSIEARVLHVPRAGAREYVGED